MPTRSVPASGVQQRMWLAERFEPEAGRYNVPLAWRVRGRLDPPRLADALAVLVERHEILRTRFAAEDGRLLQFVDEPWRPELAVVDLTDSTKAVQESRLRGLLDEAARHTFDVGSGALLTAALAELGPDEQVLVLCLHHLVHDGESTAVLLSELDACYQAAGEAGESGAPIPAEPKQYADFVLAHSDAAQAAGLDYWAEALADVPAYLPLPAVEPPDPHGSVRIELPTDFPARLRRLQEEFRVSPYMAVAAALAVVLHGWTASDDLTFGCPVANRSPEFAAVLGPCLNNVALRSRITPDTTVGELMVSVRNAILDAYEHQEVPFEAVVERLNPPRRAGQAPYIDVSLTLDFADPAPTALGPAELTTLPVDPNGAPYAAKIGLGVAFVRSGETFEAWLNHRGDRLSRADAEQLAALLARALSTLADSVDQRVVAFDFVDDAERVRLAGFEAGPPAAAPTTVPALLDRWFVEQPDAVAVESADSVLTYGELDRRSAALAARLRPLALAAVAQTTDTPDLTDRQDRGTPVVAVVQDRGADLVVAMLAAWRAGCAFCPIDPAYPQQRREYLLQEAGACAVVSGSARIREELADSGVPVLSPHSESTDVPEPVVTPSPDDTAYVLYTSGTTGQPKGVEIRHGGLAQLALWWASSVGITPADRVSNLSGVGFDATQWEVWAGLAAGACLVAAAPGVAPEVAKWLTEHSVTVAFLVTPLAEAVWATGAALPTVRVLGYGAAALTGPLPTDHGYRLVNNYGPTESTVVATSTVRDPVGDGRNVIGRPIDGTSVYVLDVAGRRCAVGVPGEIHIGGAGVARGYWRRPELTRERFLPSGPDGAPGPVFRTGDRGRWLPDGTLEFLGRLDRQLKIRGHRIEPAEIEANLLDDPLVEAAVVLGFPDRVPTLVAYLVGEDSDTPAVLGRLRDALPSFLIPDAVVWLDRLPMSAHGKLDVAALPVPGREDLVSAVPWIAPSGAVQTRVARLWSQVLGIAEVGAHDAFFDLGGNSLLLAALHARLERTFARELPVHALFEYPTVAAFARYLGDAAGSSPGSSSGSSSGSSPGSGPGSPPGDAIADRAAAARRARLAARPKEARR